jgi:hypothetical protein
MKSAGLVVNFHCERRLGMKTLRFVRAAVEHLEQQGIALHCRLVLDRADEFTRSAVSGLAAGVPRSEVLEVDFGNLGASRAAGVARIDEKIVFFLDGDDFVSFNWFEKALEFFRAQGAGGEKLIAHTQFFVGFDKELFVRLGVDSRDDCFDALALAADWFFCNNLACHRSVFDAVPIEPYDHAGGFGAEDWHWSCETIARGFAHCLVPGTSYFYRGKPAKFSLGSAGQLVPRRSTLFDPPWVNAQATLRTKPAPRDEALAALDAEFYAEAERLVPFDFGLSYLRSLHAGAREVYYFRPGVPDEVAQSVRQFAAIDGTGGVDIIHADVERIPGAIAKIDDIVAQFGDKGAQRPRFYLLEGRPLELPPDDAINVVWLDRLKAAGTNEAQISRLIARFFIQSTDVRVFNFVSPRKRSLASSLAAAKRHSISVWYNLVLEYGLDRFSSTVTEVKEILAAGIAAETVAVFAKTARELVTEAEISVLHATSLEARYVSGERTLATETVAQTPAPAPSFEVHSPLASRESVPRMEIADEIFVEFCGEADTLTGTSAYLYLILGDATVSRETLAIMENAALSSLPTIAVPELIVRKRDTGNVYFRPDLAQMNAAVARGTFPFDLLQIPVLGFDMLTARPVWEELVRSNRTRIRLARLLREYLNPKGYRTKANLVFLGRNTIATCDESDMRRLDGARVALGVFRTEARRANTV